MRTLLVALVALLGLCKADSDLKCDNTTLHEVRQCRFGCPPQRTCQNFRGPIPPCAPPRGPCTDQCVCAGGYARNKWGGTCVTLDQCDQCPGNNQYFSCDGPYSETCTGSCHCADGYKRDANNICVSTTPPPVVTQPSPPPPPIVLPSPVTSGPRSVILCNTLGHEVAACVFEYCPPERTCENIKLPVPLCGPTFLPCKPKCVCDEGYARNREGKCVTFEQCAKCGENEIFQCDGEYSENCVGICNCLSGYTRDVNNKCIYVDPASPPKDFGPPYPEPEPQVLTCNATKHEISACTYGCPPEKTCQNRDWPPLPCARPDFPCTQKCVCDDGYARNQDGGTCVTLEQCEKCGENEYFQCDGDYCENCVGHCHCFSGYTRDINNKCVYVDPATPPRDNGPPTPEPEVLTCNATQHEISVCTYGCPPEKTCQNRDWPPLPCAPPAFPCTQKCVCDDGYARNQDGGTCVTLEQCEKCGENEYFQCDGEYCENCVGHCHCFSGYTRDINNKCVYVDPATPPRDNGPPTPEPEVLTCNATQHEISVCTYGCPPEKTCQNRDWPPPPCAAPPLDFPCTQKCVCDNGYARNQGGGTCVTLEQCEKCGENEYFQCDGAYCENCVGHCHCFSGYTRDINNKCVYVDPATPPRDNGPPTPEPEVLTCNATQHEISVCTYGCPPEKTCQNRNWPPPSCAPPRPDLPCTPKCVCDNGYARNQGGGTCVTLEQCEKCGENEYFKCDGEYCENCVGHCHCLSGYKRDINKKCVYVDPATPPRDNGPPTPKRGGYQRKRNLKSPKSCWGTSCGE